MKPSLLRWAIAASVACLLSSSAMSAEIKWGTDLSKALQQLKDQKEKLVLVDFFTTWCGWCKKLDAETYTDRNVINLVEERFVAVKVDGDKRPNLVSRYEVQGYPTVVILDSQDRVVKKIVGYRPPQAFLAELKEALELASLAKEIPGLENQAKADDAQAAQAAAKLGYIYRRLGDEKKALAYLQQAREAGYRDPGFDLDWMLATEQGGKLVNDLKSWCNTHTDHPRRWEALYELGLAQARMSLWTDALASFDAVARGAAESVWGIRSADLARTIRERYLRPEASRNCPACR
ncbi:MAG: DUF255 domain-containing protein [Armatimonadetes bacterium]|nr:DUF255 domain-containing protein [Armatimonadota bacterium]